MLAEKWIEFYVWIVITTQAWSQTELYSHRSGSHTHKLTSSLSLPHCARRLNVFSLLSSVQRGSISRASMFNKIWCWIRPLIIFLPKEGITLGRFIITLRYGRLNPLIIRNQDILASFGRYYYFMQDIDSKFYLLVNMEYSKIFHTKLCIYW